jgi:nitronate monooxygenase
MQRVDDFRLRFGKRELVPIMIGSMGVDISTAEMAVEAGRLGGIGHISDAMINTVLDLRLKTSHVKDKRRVTTTMSPAVKRHLSNAPSAW